MKKEIQLIDYRFDDRMLTTKLTFDDGSKAYVFVQNGMIYVADCDYNELCKRIDNDDTDSYEAYDTTDGCDYYMRSEYSEYINCSLLQIANRFL